MDATTGSSGNGFDAALRALEDLETSVAQAREENAAPTSANPTPSVEAAPAPAAVAPASSGAIAFSEGDDAPATVITAIPVVDVEEASPAPAPTLTPTLSPTLAVETAVEPSPAPALAAAPVSIAVPPVASAAPVATPLAPAPVTGASPIVAETAAPAPEHLPDPAPVAVAAATPASVEAVVAPAAPRGSKLGKVAIGLGLVSSVVSAAGLIIAERTIMSAQLVVADARERQEQLKSANKLIHDLQLVRDKQLELLKAQQVQLAAAPVTSAELQHRMESLQAGLLARDPLTQVVETVREGQGMTNARLNEFERKMDRLESVVTGRGAPAAH